MDKRRAFDGETYDPDKDYYRLSGQLGAVWMIMFDGKWRSIPRIQELMGGQATTQSISARLRDFRKTKYGAHTVERRLKAEGFYQYRLIVNRGLE
jgi:hypothetical protein